jgi:tRNA G18 (ribose-2'-O)-methylase SpoU
MLPGKLKFQPQAIVDPADPRVADFFALNDPHRRRAIERDGRFFVAEGVLVIRQLLLSPYPVRAVLATPQALAALGEVEAPVYTVDQTLMSSIAGFHFHRGALASADRGPYPEVEDVVTAARLVLMAEGVTDNENLGALFRNAGAFGVGGVVLDGTSADPLYRRSVRVSMGQVLRLPFTRVPDAVEAVRRLQAHGFEVLALTPAAGADDIRTVAPGGRRALLVGAEGPGLTAGALAAADRRVRIAMRAGVDSLNVATAAAVALHHLAGSA